MTNPEGGWSQVPKNRDEQIAKVANLAANLRIIKNHLFNYVGDDEVDGHLARALDRLSQFDLSRSEP